MSDIQRLCEGISALATGWSEHIEYAERITVHTARCNRTQVYACECPEVVEKRGKNVRHPGLLAQLEASSAMMSSCTSGTSGTQSNKPGSRPPGNVSYLMLADYIGEEARHRFITNHTMYYSIAPSMMRTMRSATQVLHELTSLAVSMQDEYPDVVRETTGEVRGWVSKARIALGYQKPHVLLANTSCHNCGGALAVASDASTDVRCTAQCGTVYRRDQWLSLL